jgi:hypothetical protein
LGHLSPPPPSLPGRTCFALFSNFVEEKTSYKKKDIAFLLVSDYGSVFS